MGVFDTYTRTPFRRLSLYGSAKKKKNHFNENFITDNNNFDKGIKHIYVFDKIRWETVNSKIWSSWPTKRTNRRF